jgi:hypothetical protein
MMPRPNNRALQSGDTVTRKAAVVGAFPTERKAATAADILGRDPREENFVTGQTGLIRTQSKIANRKPQTA